MTAFARALGMRPQTLNNYLSGQMNPGNILQAKLRELGCDIEWLMTGESKKEEPIGARERAMLTVLQELNIHCPDELRKCIEDREKLLRSLGPVAYQTLLEGTMALERQAAGGRLKKRKS